MPTQSCVALYSCAHFLQLLFLLCQFAATIIIIIIIVSSSSSCSREDLVVGVEVVVALLIVVVLEVLHVIYTNISEYFSLKSVWYQVYAGPLDLLLLLLVVVVVVVVVIEKI